MLYALTEGDKTRLQSILSWWDRFGPGAMPQSSTRRFYVDRRCKGLLKGNLSSTDLSASVDNVKLICGTCPTTSSTATVTVYNPDGISGADNNPVRFEWVISSTRGSTGDQGAWEFIDSSKVGRRCTCIAVDANLTGTIVALDAVGGFDMDTVEGITFDGWLPPFTDADAIISVKNPIGFSWDTGAVGFIEENLTHDCWVLYMVGPCPGA